MNSNDVIVVIGGQEYIIEGRTLKPAENGFQNEVLNRLDGIESRLDKVESRLDGLESRVGVIESELGYIRHDQSTMFTFMYWILGALAIFIGIPGLLQALGQLFRKPQIVSHAEDPKPSQPLITLDAVKYITDTITKRS